MNSLKEIETTLRSALGSDALFGLVNTRLVLRTGVDLTEFAAVDNRDPAKVSVVLEALKALGYSTAALQMVANKRKTT